MTRQIFPFHVLETFILRDDDERGENVKGNEQKDGSIDRSLVLRFFGKLISRATGADESSKQTSIDGF
jgi:hypothetical protein